MATQVKIILECDLGSSEHGADMTVDWALDGVSYTLDLCEPHGEQMGKAVAEYVAASRIAGAPASPLRSRARRCLNQR